MKGSGYHLRHHGVTILSLVSFSIVYSLVCFMSTCLNNSQLHYCQIKVLFYKKRENLVGLETAIFFMLRIVGEGYESWT